MFLFYVFSLGLPVLLQVLCEDQVSGLRHYIGISWCALFRINTLSLHHRSIRFIVHTVSIRYHHLRQRQEREGMLLEGVEVVITGYFCRCKNCYKCPRCTCVLSTRAHVAQLDAAKSVTATEGKDQAAPKATETSPSTTRRALGRSSSGSSVKGDIKKYYLQCNCCQWSTRQANIPDVKNSKNIYHVSVCAYCYINDIHLNFLLLHTVAMQLRLSLG